MASLGTWLEGADVVVGFSDTGYSFDRSVDILVSRLRRKMEDDPKTPKLILTVRSGGYQFLPETTSE